MSWGEESHIPRPEDILNLGGAGSSGDIIQLSSQSLTGPGTQSKGAEKGGRKGTNRGPFHPPMPRLSPPFPLQIAMGNGHILRTSTENIHRQCRVSGPALSHCLIYVIDID